MNAVFQSEAECNKLGKDISESCSFEDKSLKSFSTCIPESVYEEKGLQSQRLP
ncbi:hypothetical protein SPDO_21960 [Sphingomonas dokdonensis]|uniref:Uncharacterized protein n=1 Tax=Sphingomonas dokdonensis TaxID=344880 RepID=A0A245ZHJ5_9SPHN|nr:hypothetical protein SPDO_21960 [Sphingomonas dokdonensis]